MTDIRLLLVGVGLSVSPTAHAALSLHRVSSNVVGLTPRIGAPSGRDEGIELEPSRDPQNRPSPHPQGLVTSSESMTSIGEVEVSPVMNSVVNGSGQIRESGRIFTCLYLNL